MKAIGFKRLMILLGVLGINAVLAVAYFFVLEPMLSETRDQLSSVESQITQTRTKIQSIKADLIEYQKNLPRYSVLENAGFFSTQDRLELKDHFQSVQSRSGLKRFAFTVEDRQDLYTLPAGKENMRVLSSKIQIGDPVGFFDTEFFGVVDLMRTVFPAHIHFSGLDIERTGPVTADILNQMRSNPSTSLIKGNAYFQWLTIIPEPKEDPTQQGQRFGGRGSQR